MREREKERGRGEERGAERRQRRRSGSKEEKEDGERWVKKGSRGGEAKKGREKGHE